jgi:hypothetical protein
MSLLEGTTDFSFSGFIFLSPQRIYTVSLREGTTDFAFNGFIFSSLQTIFTVFLREGTMDFAFNGITLCISPEDLHRLTLERTFTGFTLRGFSFTFKSPTVLSS